MQSKNAGLIIRSFAWLLDIEVFILLFSAGALFFSTKLNPNSPLYSVITLLAYVFVSIMFLNILLILYRVFLISKFGGTLGKLLYGLKILYRDNDQYVTKKTVFLRSTAGYRFSSKFCGLGFLKIYKHPEKLGWHDELFFTRVVRKGSFIPGIIVQIFITGAVVFLLYNSTANTIKFVENVNQAINEKLDASEDIIYDFNQESTQSTQSTESPFDKFVD